MKTCLKCRTPQPACSFNLHRRKPDGLDIYCKACRAAYRISRSLINSESARQWRQKNPDRVVIHSRQWRTANPDINKISQRKYRQTHKRKSVTPKKQYPATAKVYRIQHAPERKQHKKNRRAANRLAKGSFTAEQWELKCQFHGWLCYYCKIPLTGASVTQDHRIPLSRGGYNHLSNIAPCCSRCNSKKHSKTELEFRPRQ